VRLSDKVWSAIDLFAAEVGRDERRKDRDDGGIDRSERGFAARGRSSGAWISRSRHSISSPDPTLSPPVANARHR
jgi:hypothetical protein